MIRSFTIASLVAAGFALPALANEPATTSGASVSSHASELSNLATEKQIHNILASQGYVQITEFGHDDNGRWTAAAMKDGKKVLVSVAMPARSAVNPSN